MASGFDVNEFAANPSREAFEKCCKANLVLVAQHFGIDIGNFKLKKEIKPVVLEGLVQQGVLGHSPEVGLSGAALPETLETGGSPSVLPNGESLSFSPTPTGSLDEVKLKVRLARLNREREDRMEKEKRETAEKARALKAEHDHQLAMRRLELDFQMKQAISLRKLELESVTLQPVAGATSPASVAPATLAAPAPTSGTSSSTITSPALQGPKADILRHIELPPFRESEVDSFFQTFERLAVMLNWPKQNWSTLLQCKLTGKAQHVIASLPLVDSLDYDVCKTAVLRAYELVPEAYRQQFRSYQKDPTKTFVEFAREKGALFDKWCVASKANTFESLRELILLEEFKKCAPERCVVYLNEKKVTSLSEGAICADEYVLTHKEVFVTPSGQSSSSVCPDDTTSPGGSKVNRECFYCHKRGHVMADCLMLKHKQQANESSSG